MNPIQGADSPVERLRMAYRVREALSSVEDLDLIETSREPPLSGSEGIFQGDFVIAALDVRIFLVLLPGSTGANQLTEPSIRDRAQLTLEHFIENDAIAVVADDEALTTVIFEPFDKPETYRVPDGQSDYSGPTKGPTTLPDAVRSYLALFGRAWQVIEQLPQLELPSIEDEAQSGAARKLAELQAQTLFVEEKVRARESLDAEDAAWAAALANSVYRSEPPRDLKGQAESRARRES
jgi:hypothetical protein